MRKPLVTTEAALDVISPVEKVSSDGNPLPRLRALLELERRDLGVVFVYSIGVCLLTLVMPVAVQAVVNFVALGSLLQPLVILTLFVLVAQGFSSVMNASRVFTVEIIGNQVRTNQAWSLYSPCRQPARSIRRDHRFENSQRVGGVPHATAVYRAFKALLSTTETPST